MSDANPSDAVREALAAYHEAVIAEALEALPGYAGRIDGPLLEGLEWYLRRRTETGGFLRAVLENDFNEAVGRAHPCLTMAALRALRELIFNFFPGQAWGSPEKVAAWLAKGESA